MRRSLVIAALSASLFATAQPAEAYLVHGSVPCDVMLREDGNEGFALANRWWLLGYVTARNFADDASVGEGVTGDFIYNFVLDFCRNNPERDMDDGAIQLYNALR